MRTTRHALAVDPLRFGRRPVEIPLAAPMPASALGDDMRLFAVTFAAGFVFVSVLLA